MKTNGVARGTSGDAGGGVIICNNIDIFILALTLNFGHCSAFKTEALTLF